MPRIQPEKTTRKSVTQGAAHIPEVMADLMCVALHDVERRDGSDFRMRRLHVVGCFEGGGTPGIGGSNQRDQPNERRQLVIRPCQIGTPNAGSELMVHNRSVPKRRTSTVCHT